ncbi:hypothetical protein D3C72_1652920 [compost metagenome]
MGLPVVRGLPGIFVQHHFAAPLQVLTELPQFLICTAGALLVGVQQLFNKQRYAGGIYQPPGQCQVQAPMAIVQALQQGLDEMFLLQLQRTLQPLHLTLRGDVLRDRFMLNFQGQARLAYARELAQTVKTGNRVQAGSQHLLTHRQVIECGLQGG